MRGRALPEPPREDRRWRPATERMHSSWPHAHGSRLDSIAASGVVEWPLCSRKPVPCSRFGQQSASSVYAYLRGSLPGCTHCYFIHLFSNDLWWLERAFIASTACQRPSKTSPCTAPERELRARSATTHRHFKVFLEFVSSISAHQSRRATVATPDQGIPTALPAIPQARTHFHACGSILKILWP